MLYLCSISMLYFVTSSVACLQTRLRLPFLCVPGGRANFVFLSPDDGRILSDNGCVKVDPIELKT